MTYRFAAVVIAACTGVACAANVGQPPTNRRPPTGSDPSNPGDYVPPSCAAVTLSAGIQTAPVDIVWVADTSDSMQNERGEVGRRLSDFTTRIASAGIDPHVVLITMPNKIAVPSEFSSDREHFLLVPSFVGSSKPLTRLLSNLHGQTDPIPNSGYAAFLRADGQTHFVAVTDDDSELSAASFDSQMRAELGLLHVDGSNRYTFHAVASEDTGGHAPCDGAAEVGDEYLSLTASSGGAFQSICSNDWSSLFDRLATRITETTTLPCIVHIPSPADGEAIDFDTVNVVYLPGQGGSTTLPGVGSAAGCGPAGGWYYDSAQAPSAIELCPATCDAARDDAGGTLDLQLGCETVLL